MIEAAQYNPSASAKIKYFKNRTRWDGILSKVELQQCHEQGIDIAYDCSQQGWVIYNEEEAVENDLFTVEQYGENSISGAKDIEALLKDFQCILTGVSDTTMNHLSVCFQTAQRILNRSNYEDDLKLRDQHHFILLQKVVALLNFELPNPSDIPVSFRRWNKADVGVFRKIMGNRKVWLHLAEDYPESFDDMLAEHLIEVANIDNPVATNQAIVFDGDVVGHIRLSINEDYAEFRGAEVVYVLDEAYWGRGLMSKILSRFVNDAFSRLRLDFIYAWIKPENGASIRVAEQAGFIKDRFSREQELATISQRAGFSRYLCLRNANIREVSDLSC